MMTELAADDAALEDDLDAVAAVRVGLWVSAARCVLTYLVAPLLGAAGVVLGPFGLLLQVAGAITATAGASRLWRTGHRLRTPYVVVAVAVDLVTLLVLAQAGTGLLTAVSR